MLVSYSSDESSEHEEPGNNRSKRRKLSKDDKVDDVAVAVEQAGDKRVTAPTERASKNKKAESQDLPPLPAGFHDLYATNARTSTSDDPSLHGGRKRQVPHVEGNWPSHVYLEWRPTPSQHKALNRIISAQSSLLKTPIQSLLTTPLSTPSPLHISLSRTLSIPTSDRQKFLSALQRALASHRPAFSAFSVRFRSRMEWYPNYEGNRWFLALRARRLDGQGDELNGLLKVVNRVCGGLGLGGLYEREGDGKGDQSDRFHVSLASTLEDPKTELKRKSTIEQMTPISDKDLEILEVEFHGVKIKIGNAIHNVALDPKKAIS